MSTKPVHSVQHRYSLPSPELFPQPLYSTSTHQNVRITLWESIYYPQTTIRETSTESQNSVDSKGVSLDLFFTEINQQWLSSAENTKRCKREKKPKTKDGKITISVLCQRKKHRKWRDKQEHKLNQLCGHFTYITAN